MKNSSATNQPKWIALRGQPPRDFYPCHIDNMSFEKALEVFSAKSTKFNATLGVPRAGRHFMLQLPSGRFAIIARYDDFPYSLEFSLEIEDRDEDAPIAHIEDLKHLLTPLGLPIPDKSNDGVLHWIGLH